MKKLLIAVSVLVLACGLRAQNCDPVVHNSLPPDATNRSPSQCEAELDLKIRKAVGEMMKNVKLDGWMIQTQTPVQGITQIAKGSEKNYFDWGATDVGRYELKLVMDPSGEAYKKWYREYDTIMNHLNDPGGIDKAKDYFHDMRMATSLLITIEVNRSFGTLVLKGNYSSPVIAHVPYAIQAKWVGGMSGGGEDNAVDATVLYLGKYNAPKIKKEENGWWSSDPSPVFTKGSPFLSVQNMFVRIEGNAVLANTVIGQMDLTALDKLFK